MKVLDENTNNKVGSMAAIKNAQMIKFEGRFPPPQRAWKRAGTGKLAKYDTEMFACKVHARIIGSTYIGSSLLVDRVI